MNTTETGELSEAIILATLISAGYKISRPWGTNCRYDLIADLDGSLFRVQCKTGRIIRDAVEFSAKSSYAHRGRRSKAYHGDVEAIAVYCPENKQVYFVPISKIGRASCRLRIKPTKNNQKKRVLTAEDFAV